MASRYLGRVVLAAAAAVAVGQCSRERYQEDEAAARQKLTEALTYQYGGKDQSGVGLAATPSRAVEVMGTLREAGAQHILLNPAYDHMRQMEVLMEKVIPQL